MTGYSAQLDQNRKTWDVAASTSDRDSAHLPYWGPYKIGPGLDLLPKIQDRVFLEIGCGAGRSIRYLVDEGAERVYALDISSTQIELARKNNIENLDKIELICSSMEKSVVSPGTIDVVISNYALGWTVDPSVTLRNIYSYLKSGALFVWSWEHPDFQRTEWDGEKLIYKYSYFEDQPYLIGDFRQSGPAYLYPRTVSFWFEALISSGFEIVRYLEPKPQVLDYGRYHDGTWGYYSPEKAKIVPATMIFVCRKA